MHIQIVDTSNQTVWARPESMIVVIPGPLTPGDGKCRVLIGAAVVEVTRQEADRLVQELTPSLL